MNTIDMANVEAKDAIKDLRNRLSESQTEFANRFDLKQRVISTYESGSGYPRAKLARKLAQLSKELGAPYDLGTFLPE